MLRLLLILLVGGCIAPAATTPAPGVPAPTISDGWQTLAPGLERRITVPEAGNALSPLLALRFDPAHYTFRAVYRPGQPLNVVQWQQELPGAAAFVNANFFTPEHQILGLLVAGGAVYGSAYTDRGGTFAVLDGAPRIFANVGAALAGTPEQAVQGFPMLVMDGLQAFTSAAPDRATRRTAIGQDAQGRVVLIVTPLLGLTLRDLSAYLPTSDLGLVNAFNLDGGGSTMLFLAAPGEPEYSLPSFDPVPAVLAVYPRGS
jgi:uncharacterized protein YigE (DUF2233 family)